MDDARALALTKALDFHADIDGDMRLQVGEDRDATYRRLEQAVLATAETWLAWLRGPTHLIVSFGPIVNQETKLPTGSTHTGGTTMQLHDNEQVDVTVRPVDAKGFESADALEFTVSDDTVVSVVGATDEDSHTATLVAGNPGSAVVTITDPTAIDPATSAPIFVTIAVDTLPAGAVALNVEVGTPVVQP